MSRRRLQLTLALGAAGAIVAGSIPVMGDEQVEPQGAQPPPPPVELERTRIDSALLRLRAFEQLTQPTEPLVGPPDPCCEIVSITISHLPRWPQAGTLAIQRTNFPWIGSTAWGGSNSGQMRYAVYLPGIDSFSVHSKPYTEAPRPLPRLQVFTVEPDDTLTPIDPNDPWHPPLLPPDEVPEDTHEPVVIPFRLNDEGTEGQDDDDPDR